MAIRLRFGHGDVRFSCVHLGCASFGCSVRACNWCHTVSRAMGASAFRWHFETLFSQFSSATYATTTSGHNVCSSWAVPDMSGFCAFLTQKVRFRRRLQSRPSCHISCVASGVVPGIRRLSVNIGETSWFRSASSARFCVFQRDTCP